MKKPIHRPMYPPPAPPSPVYCCNLQVQPPAVGGCDASTITQKSISRTIEKPPPLPPRRDSAVPPSNSNGPTLGARRVNTKPPPIPERPLPSTLMPRVVGWRLPSWSGSYSSSSDEDDAPKRPPPSAAQLDARNVGSVGKK